MSNNPARELTPEEKESTLSTPATSMYEPNPSGNKARESIPDEGTDVEDNHVDNEAAVEVEYASGLKLGAIVVALALSVFLVSLDMTIVATAIPKITDVRFTPSHTSYANTY